MKSDLLQIINDNINPNNIKEILDKIKKYQNKKYYLQTNIQIK